MVIDRARMNRINFDLLGRHLPTSNAFMLLYYFSITSLLHSNAVASDAEAPWWIWCQIWLKSTRSTRTQETFKLKDHEKQSGTRVTLTTYSYLPSVWSPFRRPCTWSMYPPHFKRSSDIRILVCRMPGDTRRLMADTHGAITCHTVTQSHTLSGRESVQRLTFGLTHAVDFLIKIRNSLDTFRAKRATLSHSLCRCFAVPLPSPQSEISPI